MFLTTFKDLGGHPESRKSFKLQHKPPLKRLRIAGKSAVANIVFIAVARRPESLPDTGVELENFVLAFVLGATSDSWQIKDLTGL
jgi:hypothetical protein